MLAGRMQSALCAFARVTPRAHESRPVRGEEDREVLALPVYLEPEVWTPFRRDLAGPGPDSFEDPSKSHPVRIEEPGAATRLEDKWFHTDIVAGQPVRCL